MQRVRLAEDVVRKLEANNWDFDSAPEIFAEKSQADVLAKEIVHIHDGQMMTRVGRLVMGGVGEMFNLMGPIPSNSTFKVTSTHLIDEINQQLGTEGLRELPEFRSLGTPERVEFFNYTNFYQLRDLVFWAILYGSGAYPSTFEHMARHFAGGEVVQNVMYRSSSRSLDETKPKVMMSSGLTVSFPSKVVEWMDKPLFGGLAKETMHVEYLLTPKPSKVSHPYLPLTGEAVVEYCHQRYYLRRFAGVTPKDGLRGPGVPPEHARRKKAV
ncbi:MAG TPA: hypothetical protein VF498_11910 [Anaerolineales bacterium]